jgi:DnaJ like chaperone protein
VSWWGKAVGGAFGFMLGGPIGALLGVAVGHHFDRGLGGVVRRARSAFEPGSRERVQTAFFTATFSVMGHLAKADGRVSEQEIDMARAVMAQMDLSGELRKAAIRLFSEGKRPDFPLDDVVDQFRRECHRRQTLMQMFLELQIQAALADGDIHPQEERLLKRIAERLGFAPGDYARLVEMIRAGRHYAGGPRTAGPSLKDAYAILNVSEKAGDAEVTKAYRRLMNQHHPDKLVAKGLPEEMMRIATEKTREIKAAYEAIRKVRGI